MQTFAPEAPGPAPGPRPSFDPVPAAAPAARHWELRRNCALTPRQCGACFGAMGLFHVLLALVFWALGFPVISLFAGLEVTVLALALLCYARHACDRETIILAAGCLAVEQHEGPRVRRTELRAAWVRVQPPAAPGALVRLSAGARSVHIGRHLRPAQRQAVAAELRRALATAATQPETACAPAAAPAPPA